MANPTLRTLLVPCVNLSHGLDFYSGALGLPVRFRDGDRYAALAAGALTLALATPAEHPAHGEVLMCFKADDVEAAVAGLRAAGARVLDPPRTSDHEVRALLRDPSGVTFSVYGPRPPTVLPQIRTGQG
jgi:predicted enzyme related to lactoylglutathione lyase